MLIFCVHILGQSIREYIYLNGKPLVNEAPFSWSGSPDIMWRNLSTGDIYAWTMSGVNLVNCSSLGSVDLNWKIAGKGDFNGDGKIDILWRNNSTGEKYVWYMNGVVYLGGDYILQVPDLNWKNFGTRDVNGDGKNDILWRNTSTGENYVWYMNGIVYATGAYLPPWAGS